MGNKGKRRKIKILMSMATSTSMLMTMIILMFMMWKLNMLTIVDFSPFGHISAGQHVATNMAITPTHNLLLVVVVIVACQKVAEDHFWNVHLMFLMDLHGQTVTIVLDTDPPTLLVNVHFDVRHDVRIPHIIVRRVNQNLIKYLIETRNVP